MTTKDEAMESALALVRSAKRCCVQVRFGLSEQWLEIRKKDALELVRCSWSDDTQVESTGGTAYLS